MRIRSETRAWLQKFVDIGKPFTNKEVRGDVHETNMNRLLNGYRTAGLLDVKKIRVTVQRKSSKSDKLVNQSQVMHFYSVSELGMLAIQPTTPKSAIKKMPTTRKQKLSINSIFGQI